MSDISAIGSLIVSFGALITGAVALYMARASKNKTQAETKKLDTEAAKLDDDRFQAREIYWNGVVKSIKEEFEDKIDELERKVSGLQLLIEGHIPWDWEALRKLKLNDIEQRDPPTLIWIEEQRREM